MGFLRDNSSLNPSNPCSLLIFAYRVVEEIENYNRIGGLKNEISRLAAQRYAMNEKSAPRNRAITSLLKLQNYGITDVEILNVANS